MKLEGPSDGTGRDAIAAAALRSEWAFHPVPQVAHLRAKPVSPLPARVLVTREEAAAMLAMSVDSFERYAQPHVKLVRLGSLVLVAVSDLTAWAERAGRTTLP